MPKKNGVYLIVAIRRNFNVVDFTTHLDGSFIFNNREISSGLKDLGDKFPHMCEDTTLMADEETNMIRKIGTGKEPG